jgi:ubiquinol-cytochrome c reductase iron-sulfur subunit
MLHKSERNVAKWRLANAAAESTGSPKPAQRGRPLPDMNAAIPGHFPRRGRFETILAPGIRAGQPEGKAGLMADTTGTATPDSVAITGEEGVRRRDFINIAAVGAAGVGGVITLLPLISQMAPSADVLAESSTEVDVSAIEPGQAIKAVFRKQPLFVRRLTAKEIAEANAVATGSLRDPQTLTERTKEGHEDMLITMGVCTHLGCVPLGAAEGENKGEFGGYFCPCHGSHYDTAGRIRKGPAPTNLEVPEYEFTSDTVVRVG